MRKRDKKKNKKRVVIYFPKSEVKKDHDQTDDIKCVVDVKNQDKEDEKGTLIETEQIDNDFNIQNENEQNEDKKEEIVEFQILFEEQEQHKGRVMIIGGGPDHEHKEIMPKILEIAGGLNACIGIINTGHLDPADVAVAYEADFKKYGEEHFGIKVEPYSIFIDITNSPNNCNCKQSAYDPLIIAQIERCTAFYFTGGDQSRTVDAFIDEGGKNTPALEAILRVWKLGGLIAGTSSGAAMMSDPMLISGVSFTSLYYVKGSNTGVLNYYNRYDDLAMVRGLGLVKNAIVDPHLIKRGRLGRIIVAMLEAKKRFGYGVGELSAMILGTANVVEVIGDNGIVVVDFSKVEWIQNKPYIEIKNVRLHFLGDKDRFDQNLHKIYPKNGKKEASINLFAREMLEKIAHHLMDNMVRDYPYRTLRYKNTYCFEVSSFDLEVAFEFALSRDQNTVAFYGDIDEPRSYTIKDLRLDIVPMYVITEPYEDL